MQKTVAITKKRIKGGGGVASVISSHVRVLNSLGVEPYILTEKFDSLAKESSFKDLRYKPVILRSFFRNSLEKFDKKCKRWAAAHKPDLFMSHGDNVSDDIFEIHNCYHYASELVNKRPPEPDDEIALMYDKVFQNPNVRVAIANSRFTAEDLSRRHGVPAEKITVVYPDVDLAVFNTDDKAAKKAKIRSFFGLGMDDKAIALVTSGQFNKRNALFFIDVVKALTPRHPDIKAFIIGKDDPKPLLEKMRSENISNISVHSVIDDAGALYHGFDLCVLPAVIEEFGCVVTEAMACGVPSLVSRNVGAGELYTDYGVEMALPLNSVQPWVDKIARLLSDQGYYNTVVTKGLEIVRNYSEKNVALLTDIFMKFLEPNAD